MRKCPYCKTELFPDDVNCPQCGVKIPNYGQQQSKLQDSTGAVTRKEVEVAPNYFLIFTRFLLAIVFVYPAASLLTNGYYQSATFEVDEETISQTFISGLFYTIWVVGALIATFTGSFLRALAMGFLLSAAGCGYLWYVAGPYIDQDYESRGSTGDILFGTVWNGLVSEAGRGSLVALGLFLVVLGIGTWVVGGVFAKKD